MIGMDTCAIIDLFQGNASVRESLDAIEEPLVSTQLNYLELLFGIDITNPKHVKEKVYYDDFFSEVALLPLDGMGVKRSSEVFWNAVKRGKEIGKFDSIVAGVLLAHGVTKIITRDASHFEASGLKVIRY